MRTFTCRSTFLYGIHARHGTNVDLWWGSLRPGLLPYCYILDSIGCALKRNFLQQKSCEKITAVMTKEIFNLKKRTFWKRKKKYFAIHKSMSFLVWLLHKTPWRNKNKKTTGEMEKYVPDCGWSGWRCCAWASRPRRTLHRSPETRCTTDGTTSGTGSRPKMSRPAALGREKDAILNDRVKKNEVQGHREQEVVRDVSSGYGDEKRTLY